ncbi:MAG: exodeoxyribonuclease VII small subunit [Saprospiraceae bacterium]|nr:exodeoxyribonuclease VII small subunit [Saprospiraceae bacterium]
MTYDKALAELNSILELLQNGQTGLDELAKSLARAGELYAFCKNKLRDIEADVEKFKKSLD